MTCKECIYSIACNQHLDAIQAENRFTEPPVCAIFKDRSRFVELPCKLGDEIFYTTMGKIHQAVVDRIELYDEGVAIITTDGYCPDSSICYHTQEEAEQALKERE